VVHNTALNSSDNLPSSLISSDDFYRRRGEDGVMTAVCWHIVKLEIFTRHCTGWTLKLDVVACVHVFPPVCFYQELAKSDDTSPDITNIKDDVFFWDSVYPQSSSME